LWNCEKAEIKERTAKFPFEFPKLLCTPHDFRLLRLAALFLPTSSRAFRRTQSVVDECLPEQSPRAYDLMNDERVEEISSASSMMDVIHVSQHSAFSIQASGFRHLVELAACGGSLSKSALYCIVYEPPLASQIFPGEFPAQADWKLEAQRGARVTSLLTITTHNPPLHHLNCPLPRHHAESSGESTFTPTHHVEPNSCQIIAASTSSRIQCGSPPRVEDSCLYHPSDNLEEGRQRIRSPFLL
jgi:hypothetical protein